MKKLTILIAVFVLAVNSVSAQAAKSVYVELGGPGLASVNFDMRFANKEDGFGGRVGIGGFSVNDGSDGKISAIFIPIGVNYLIGKDSKNYFEMGAGVTPVVLSAKYEGDNDSFTGTFGHLLFGYRLQPANGGFTFRAFICPVFGNGGFIPYYAGLSFGYKFGK